MRSIKSVSSLETAYKRRLRKLGFKFQSNPKSIIGKPDIFFKKENVAVFIDSCFWHACKKHLRMPKTNKSYWHNKIRSNIKRDRLVNKLNAKIGIKTIRFWGHDLKNNSDKSIKHIQKFVKI